jgi:hypothetical protein
MSYILILALGGRAWGRALFAAQIAQELETASKQIKILTDFKDLTIFSSDSVEVIDERCGREFRAILSEMARLSQWSAVVLCDYYSVLRYLKDRNCKLELLAEFRVPVIAVDTWDSAETGESIDIFGNEVLNLDPWLPWIKHLIPVPMARIGDDVARCQAIPQTVGSINEGRKGEEAPCFLLTTASWQHALYSNSDARFCQQVVPALIKHCISHVSRAVLAHVGPVPFYGDDLKGRYLWLGTLERKEFAEWLQRADVLLSLTAAASTQWLAIATSKPVVLVRNSRFASLDEISFNVVDSNLSQHIKTWRPQGARCYPFSVWPLGYAKFLSPLLNKNELREAVVEVEIFDMVKTVQTLREIALDTEKRRALAERQRVYRDRVYMLQTVANVISSYC